MLKFKLTSLLFFYCFLSLLSCEKSSVNKGTFLKISTNVMFKMDAELKSKMKSIASQELLKAGWKIVGDSLMKEVIFPNRSVKLSNGQSVQLDSNSMISTRILEEDVYPVSIDLDGIKKNLKKVSIQSSVNNSDFKIISAFQLDMESFLFNMDGCCSNKKKSTGSKTFEDVGESELDTPRCKDFNGPFGNGKNDQNFAQSVLNFYLSDCDYAMGRGYCFTEHFNNMGGCYKTHGNKTCSSFL